MAIYKPVQNIAERDRTNKSVFLAGTIDMGISDDWQYHMSNFFNDNGWDVFNPRRDSWDSSWEQKFENPQFYQQVTWELTALEHADLIIMYFAPDSSSPISLLELGLFAKSGKIRVVCPDGFYRKGNVEIVCNIYDIPIYNDLTSAVDNII